MSFQDYLAPLPSSFRLNFVDARSVRIQLWPDHSERSFSCHGLPDLASDSILESLTYPAHHLLQFSHQYRTSRCPVHSTFGIYPKLGSYSTSVIVQIRQSVNTDNQGLSLQVLMYKGVNQPWLQRLSPEMQPEHPLSPNTTANRLGEDSLHTSYAGAKRRIAALELQLQSLQDAGTKRKS